VKQLKLFLFCCRNLTVAVTALNFHQAIEVLKAELKRILGFLEHLSGQGNFRPF
jgi:hypothetical protein